MAKTRLEKIETIKEDIKQQQAQINKLMQQQRAQDRKDRTRRLCQRMGLFESMLYEAAERYIKAHLNGRDKIPLPTWKAERDKLTAERNKLNLQYQNLKTETAAVEKIRSNVYDIMRQEQREQQPRRAHDMEL